MISFIPDKVSILNSENETSILKQILFVKICLDKWICEQCKVRIYCTFVENYLFYIYEVL